MAKKRGNGEGSISKRPNGLWQGQISLGRDPETNKLKRSTFYGKTRKEVADKINNALSEKFKGTFVEPNKTKIAEWVTRWLTDHAKNKVKQSTFEGYEIACNLRIIPELGDITLQALQTSTIQDFYSKLLKNGASGRTVQYTHVVLNQALKQAVKEQVLFRNVAEFVTVPKHTPKQMKTWDVDQLKTFLDAAKNNRFYAAFLLCWASGMRRSEILGLRWKDIDCNKNIVTVNQTLTSTKAGLILSEPKTAKSRRSIPVPKEAITALQAHKNTQADEFELVFHRKNGSPESPKTFIYHFEHVTSTAGLPKIRFHDLRHSHATLLLLLGEHPKIVQERLGHSKIGITMDIYSHIMPGMQELVADKLSLLLNPETEKPPEQN